MSEDHTSLLRFSLEESVWFQRGQEVEELYSISLEPNVSAHQVEQYVILKGTLDLMGEYKPAEATEREEAEDPFRRYVSIIEQREHHLFEFHQQFPVDITIPAERVREIDELNVGVHTFDYKLPEKGYLQISADLWIGGVYENLPDEQEQVTENREEASNYQHETTAQYQKDRMPPIWNEAIEEEEESAEEITIQAETQQKYENEQVVEPLYRVNSDEEDENESYDEAGSPEIQLNSDHSFFENSDEQDDHFYVETKLSPRFHQQQIDEHWDDTDESSEKADEYSSFMFEPNPLINRASQADFNQSFSIPQDHLYDEGPPELMDISMFKAGSEKEESYETNRAQQEQSQINAVPNLKNTTEDPEAHVYQVREQKEAQGNKKYAAKQYPSTESKRENANQEQEAKSKSLLYDLFTEQEESQQTKVRVCIVQNGENIDLLAERYKTSVQHIARINGLELSTDLKAGQVIYIPEAAASYK